MRDNQALRLYGDEKNDDVILIGKVDPALPTLYIDDFAVALRNEWDLYTTEKDHTRYYSAPGCSIDPNPSVLCQLQSVSRDGLDFSSSEGLRAYTDRWCEVGRKPQNVRVLGVPFDTRFASVMVDADYYMKRLANGSVSLGIDGLKSITDLTEDQIRREVAAGKPPTVPCETMSRFWFNPREVTYDEDDDGVLLLKSCHVGLLTEEEFLTEQGDVSGRGTPNPLAKRFAEAFTQHYSSIATAQPIYVQLEGLFRFVTIAKMMKNEEVECPGLTYLLKTYPVAKTPVSRQLPGITYVRQCDIETQSDKGHVKTCIVLPSCGGVCMDVEPKRIRPAARPKSAGANGRNPAKTSVIGIRKTILNSRISPKTLSWDFPIKDMQTD